MLLNIFLFFTRNRWIFIGLVFIAGCISLPKDQQTKNLLYTPSVTPTVEKSLATSFFTTGNWPQEKWWQMFASEQLNQLMEEALELNPSLKEVEKKIEFAKQTAIVVRSKLFPLIFFNIEDSWSYVSENGLYRALNPDFPLNATLLDLTLSFSYEFDFWGKNANLFRAAVGRAKAEEAEALQVRLIITTAIAQVYFALKTNLIKKNLYQSFLEANRLSFSLQELLQRKALLSKLPLFLSQESVLEAEKELILIQEEIETNRHLLNVLIGKGPDQPLEIDTNLPPLPEKVSIPENLSLDLVARRPDLMAQIWRVEALAHEVGAAKADFFPNISLTSFLGLESTIAALLFRSSSKMLNLEPALHLPIFTAGAIRANLNAKKAEFDQAVYEYNRVLLRATEEIADFLVLVKSVFSQKNRQEKIVEDAKGLYQLTVLRQQKGLDSLLAIYSTQEAWIEKELTNITLLYSQYLAVIKLTKALGGGYLSEYTVPLKKDDDGNG